MNYPEGEDDKPTMDPDGRTATLPDGTRLRISGDLKSAVHVGDLVRTSYHTGPHRVIEVSEYAVYGLRAFSLVIVDTDAKRSKKGEYRDSAKGYLNELVLFDGRILHLFIANEDEVFIVPDEEVTMTPKNTPESEFDDDPAPEDDPDPPGDHAPDRSPVETEWGQYIKTAEDAKERLGVGDIAQTLYYGYHRDLGEYVMSLRVLVKARGREAVKAFLKERIPKAIKEALSWRERDLAMARREMGEAVFDIVAPQVFGIPPIAKDHVTRRYSHTTPAEQLERALEQFEHYAAFVIRYEGKRPSLPKWLDEYATIILDKQVPEGFVFWNFASHGPPAFTETKVESIPDFNGADGPGEPDPQGRPWWPTKPSWTKPEKAQGALDALVMTTWLKAEVREEKGKKGPRRYRVWTALPTKAEVDAARAYRDLVTRGNPR